MVMEHKVIETKGNLGIVSRYIVLICLLMSVAAFLSPEAANAYLTVYLYFIGIVAIIFQKRLHKAAFVDMGFRLNRNTLIGLGVGLLYAAVLLVPSFLLLKELGVIDWRANPHSPFVDQDGTVTAVAILDLLLTGALMFVAALFGEELAFRGYILPKLEEGLGKTKAVVISCFMFGLWHLPVYFSTYSGGAMERGWGAVALMLLGSTISAIPLCLLYLTTRELYGVSLFHAVVDLFQYYIIGNVAFGEASRHAIYSMEVLNETASNIAAWGIQILGILLMLALCRGVKKLAGARQAG